MKQLIGQGWRWCTTIRGKILGIVAVAILALIGTSFIFVKDTQANVEAQLVQDQQIIAERYADFVSEYLNGSRSVVESLTGASEVAAPPTLPTTKELNGVSESLDLARRVTLRGALAATPRLATLAQIQRDGDVYMMEPYQIQRTLRQSNIAAAPYFQQVENTHLPVWSGIVPSLTDGTPSVAVAVPLFDRGEQFESILLATIRLDSLATAARSIKMGETTQVMLFDPRGVPIIHPDTALVARMEPLTTHPAVQAALAGQTGTFLFTDPTTGRELIGTITHLSEARWFSVIAQDRSEVLAPVRRLVTIAAGAVAVGLLVLGISTWGLARSIIGRVDAIRAVTRRVAIGDLEHDVTIRSHDELGQMADDFRAMINFQRSMASVAQAIASGDLTVELELASDKDQLGRAFQQMIVDLRERTAQAELELRLTAERANKDALTGLANRRALDSYLEAISATSNNTQIRGVLMVDVDHFKRFNDTYGHAVGDSVLRAVAETIRKSHRPNDFSARYGGEEMCVVVHDVVDAAQLRALGERLRVAISAASVADAADVHVTASIGGAMWQPGDSSDDVFNRADSALYSAKRSGRNAVRLDGDPM